MKSVQIEPGCISCGSCQYIAPEVFEVTDTSHVKQGIVIEKFASCIRDASAKCPVQVIKIVE